MRELFKEQLAHLIKQRAWLEYSLKECQTIGIKETYNIDEFGKFETLCSRYARAIDFLIRKVYRTIDMMEFEDGGTLLDVINRATKRGLVDDVEELRKLKDLRNSIVHEYIEDELIELFAEVLEATPKIIELLDRAIDYGSKIV